LEIVELYHSYTIIYSLTLHHAML